MSGKETYVGVDWSSGAWLTAVLTRKGLSDVRVITDVEEIWNSYCETARRIVVDVPIGLCGSLDSDKCGCEENDGELSRRCDDLARDVIGSRSSSIFTAPCREAARMAVDSDRTYEEVNEKNKELTGKGLTQQAANISAGIVEVEHLLLNGDGDEAVLVEGHPEVCFRALAGQPLAFSKKSAAGVEERISTLESVESYEAPDWRDVSAELREQEHRVEIDDVLDAISLAVTAAASESKLQTLPEDPPGDEMGLPMHMVYRAEEPLDNVRS